MPKKPSKPAPAAAKAQINKSEFIRSLSGVPAAEVVAKAKAKGLTISAAFVYTIRAMDKKKQGGGAAKAVKGKPGRKPGVKSGFMGGHPDEVALRRLVFSIGRARTQEILAELASIGL